MYIVKTFYPALGSFRSYTTRIQHELLMQNIRALFARYPRQQYFIIRFVNISYFLIVLRSEMVSFSLTLSRRKQLKFKKFHQSNNKALLVNVGTWYEVFLENDEIMHKMAFEICISNDPPCGSHVVKEFKVYISITYRYKQNFLLTRNFEFFYRKVFHWDKCTLL